MSNHQQKISMHYLFYKIQKQDLYMIKFLIEAYENLMTISTVDEGMGKIQITVAPDFLEDCQMILKDMGQRFPMILLDEPSDRSQANY